MRGFGGIGKIRRNIALFALAIAIRREENRLHSNQIDHALKFLLGADGDRHRHRGAAEYALHSIQGPLEIGAISIQSIDHDGARKVELVGEAPDLFRLHFDSGHAIHQHQHGIGRGKRGSRVIDEDVVARRIEDVDLGFFPFGYGDGGRDGDFASDLFVVKIGNRVAFIDTEEAVR